MKRVFAVISLMLIILLTSCTSNQNNRNDETNNVSNQDIASSANPIIPMPNDSPIALTPTINPTSNKTVLSNDKIDEGKDVLINSTIYQFSNDYAINLEEIPEGGKLPDVLYLGSYVNEKQQTELVDIYLLERGIDKASPDGVYYYNGKKYAEYYVDNEEKKICFVFHRSDFTDEDERYCVTMDLDHMEKIGKHTYNYDQKKDTVYEYIYDTNEEQIAYITYRYLSKVPFPFITEYQDVNNGENLNDKLLLRGQKFRLFEEMAKFDSSGKWLEYDDDILQPDMEEHYMCSYDESGNLEYITGNISLDGVDTDLDIDTLNEIKNSDESKIELRYRENGKLDSAYYQRFLGVYQGIGAAGNICYDEDGRMIYEEIYQTSGDKYNFYLYNDDEREPWATIYLDSHSYYSSMKDGIDYEYGNYYSIYYFEQDNTNDYN